MVGHYRLASWSIKYINHKSYHISTNLNVHNPPSHLVHQVQRPGPGGERIPQAEPSWYVPKAYSWHVWTQYKEWTTRFSCHWEGDVSWWLGFEFDMIWLLLKIDFVIAHQSKQDWKCRTFYDLTKTQVHPYLEPGSTAAAHPLQYWVTRWVRVEEQWGATQAVMICPDGLQQPDFCKDVPFILLPRIAGFIYIYHITIVRAIVNWC